MEVLNYRQLLHARAVRWRLKDVRSRTLSSPEARSAGRFGPLRAAIEFMLPSGAIVTI